MEEEEEEAGPSERGPAPPPLELELDPEALHLHLLPFLVRTYALHCLLAGQQPDAALMCAYARLRLAVGTGGTAILEAGTAGAAAWAGPHDGAGGAGARPCAELVAALSAALGLPAVADALAMPLHMARARPPEEAGAAPAGGCSSAATAAAASAAAHTAGCQSTPYAVLSRWCGVRALAWGAAAAEQAPARRAAATPASVPPAPAARGPPSRPGVDEWRRDGAELAAACSPLVARLPGPPSLIPLPRLFQVRLSH